LHSEPEEDLKQIRTAYHPYNSAQINYNINPEYSYADIKDAPSFALSITPNVTRIPLG
jgi:hypothetical protein